jgi:hypothetical protein
MRLVLIGLVTVAAAMVIDVQMASSALNYDSFFQERYCSRRVNGRYNCAFKTLEQMLASALVQRSRVSVLRAARDHMLDLIIRSFRAVLLPT